MGESSPASDADVLHEAEAAGVEVLDVHVRPFRWSYFLVPIGRTRSGLLFGFVPRAGASPPSTRGGSGVLDERQGTLLGQLGAQSLESLGSDADLRVGLLALSVAVEVATRDALD